MVGVRGCDGCQEPRAMPQKPMIPTWRTRHIPKAQLPQRMFLCDLHPAFHHQAGPCSLKTPLLSPSLALLAWGTQSSSRCVCWPCLRSAVLSHAVLSAQGRAAWPCRAVPTGLGSIHVGFEPVLKQGLTHRALCNSLTPGPLFQQLLGRTHGQRLLVLP